MEENIYPLEVKEPEAKPRLAQEPEAVLQEAQRAALALQRVVAGKRKPVIFKGEQYLEFEDWQTVAKFYGLCARTSEAAPVEIFGVKGAKAKAEVVELRSGQVVGGAEAYCMQDEANWKDKPWFQLASMAQTRAGAKALRNLLAWVVVLAGYRPTPAEEMQEAGEERKVKAEQGSGSDPQGRGEGNRGEQSKTESTAESAVPSTRSEGEGSLFRGSEEETQRASREEIQNLLRTALRCGFSTVNAEGKRCVDYHLLGQYLKSNGLPYMVRDLNRKECQTAILCLEARHLGLEESRKESQN